MTKKHYEAITAILATHGAKCHAVQLTGLHKQTCSELADYFATDNKNFDRVRFLAACGVQKSTENDCAHLFATAIYKDRKLQGKECHACGQLVKMQNQKSQT